MTAEAPQKDGVILGVAMRWWMVSLQGLALLSLSLAAACEDGEEATPISEATLTPTSMAAATPGPSPAQTPLPTRSPSGGTRGPVVTTPSPDLPVQGAQLVEVRTGQHDDFDRIVFQFEGGLPGLRVEYVKPPIVEDGSGRTVEIAGDAFLQVRFNPAGAHDPLTGQATYQGPTEILSGLPSLIEAERAGDFEAYLTWVLGLREKVDFTVHQLADPYRVAIDLQHP